MWCPKSLVTKWNAKITLLPFSQKKITLLLDENGDIKIWCYYLRFEKLLEGFSLKRRNFFLQKYTFN
jgi:hypothetical protein